MTTRHCGNCKWLQSKDPRCNTCVGLDQKPNWEMFVPSSALDKQVSGSHYKDQGIQPIIYIHANKLGFCAGNVVKYITRYKSKGGAEDIRKAIHYCQLLLELEYGEKD